MMLSIYDNARSRGIRPWLLVATLSLSMLIMGCNSGGDGEIVNKVDLPVDTAFRLYCPDVGIGEETCILDDPENSFATSNINDENKFDLAEDLPSAKSAFYMWGTAQARAPRGENQYFTGLALHELYTQGGSELARVQALRAYRYVLDNYFNSVTFFKQETPFGDVFYPASLRQLVGQNMITPGDESLAPLFDYDNELFAKEAFGEWGYYYDDDTGEITPNL